VCLLYAPECARHDSSHRLVWLKDRMQAHLHLLPLLCDQVKTPEELEIMRYANQVLLVLRLHHLFRRHVCLYESRPACPVPGIWLEWVLRQHGSRGGGRRPEACGSAVTVCYEQCMYAVIAGQRPEIVALDVNCCYKTQEAPGASWAQLAHTREMSQ
jgi:hypothetical protein